MTEREEAVIKDKILNCIDEISKPHSTNVTLVSEHLNIDFNTVWTLSKELEFEGHINFIDASSNSGKDAILAIEPEGKYFISNKRSYLEEFDVKEIIEQSFGTFSPPSPKKPSIIYTVTKAATKHIIKIIVGVIITIIAWLITQFILIPLMP